MLPDISTSQSSRWGRKMFKGGGTFSARVTLVTWETPRMIAGSYFTFGVFQLSNFQFVIHWFFKTENHSASSLWTCSLRFNVDWLVAGAGLIPVSILGSHLGRRRRDWRSTCVTLTLRRHNLTNIYKHSHKYLSTFYKYILEFIQIRSLIQLWTLTDA